MKSIRGSLKIPILILLVWSAMSCGKSEEQNQARVSETREPASVPDISHAEFGIRWPEQKAELDQNVITLKGVGARPTGTIEVRVFTNQWYLQDGEYEIENDGSWTYSGCHLRGRGNYRYHHNIKATLIVDGQVVATHTVYDVTAPEPKN